MKKIIIKLIRHFRGENPRVMRQRIRASIKADFDFRVLNAVISEG